MGLLYFHQINAAWLGIKYLFLKHKKCYQPQSFELYYIEF